MLCVGKLGRGGQYCQPSRLLHLSTNVFSPRDRAQQDPSTPQVDIADDPGDNELPPLKRHKSPANSDGRRGDQRSHGETNPNFLSRPATKGKLWQEGEPPIPRSAAAQQTQGQSQPKNLQANTRPAKRNYPNKNTNNNSRSEEEDHSVTVMLKQPETRPISQEQLVAEVKGIYAGLVMVETKCIEVDAAQNAQGDSAKLNNEQWQALIALHRTLLHEHHDFFLASQHPSANPALRRLASKYAMPARMWRHGIHSFLELLRHRLPASLEHMKTFINLAYSMMALLYETVPAFEVMHDPPPQ